MYVHLRIQSSLLILIISSSGDTCWSCKESIRWDSYWKGRCLHPQILSPGACLGRNWTYCWFISVTNPDIAFHLGWRVSYLSWQSLLVRGRYRSWKYFSAIAGASMAAFLLIESLMGFIRSQQWIFDCIWHLMKQLRLLAAKLVWISFLFFQEIERIWSDQRRAACRCLEKRKFHR